MTIEALIAVLSSGVFSIIAIYFGTKNNNKSLASKDKEITDAKIQALEDDLKNNYWNSDYIERILDLRFSHMEDKLDTIIKNTEK